MKVEFDVSLDELGRIVSLLKKWRKAIGIASAVHPTQQEVEMFRKDKIGAIRMVRNRTGCLLIEAKNALEASI